VKPQDVNFDAAINAKAHRTVDFLAHQLSSDINSGSNALRAVLRRGQSFVLTVTVPSSVTANTAKLWIGSSATGVGGALNEKALSMTMSQSGTSVFFTVFLPGTFRVGYHEVALDFGGGKVSVGRIAVLFNPFSKLDTVYMADSTKVNWYVNSPVGFLYYGDVLYQARAGIGGFAWNYHQFELLDEVLNLFSKKHYSEYQDSTLDDPIKASRYLTWMLNSAGNAKLGVLTGRWDGEYSDGDEPTTWTGSREIFFRHAKTGKPTKYGQCWVFGGILTSALRALGIPSRTITNFRSAHDSAPYDMVIDRSAGESIWNFHVWVDAWMSRPDIGRTAGWQAVDATPQERDDGKFQMGPAALADVLAKTNNTVYNVKFVAGEVDANVWRGSGTYVPGASAADFDVEDVGRYISAGRAGCTTDPQNCWEDITSAYKKQSQPRFASKQHMFSAELNPPRPQVGQGFNISLMRSHIKLSEATKVRVTMRAEQTLYTGHVLGVLKEFSSTCVMTADPSDTENTCKESKKGWFLNVEALDYLDLLSTGNSFRVSITVEPLGYGSLKLANGQTKQFFEWEKQFMLIPPPVKLTTEPAVITAGQPYVAYVQFNNPFADATLNNLTLYIDTPDFDRKARFANAVVKPSAAVSQCGSCSFVVVSFELGVYAQELTCSLICAMVS